MTDKTIFKNCLSVRENAGGWLLPMRFTDRQLSAYAVEESWHLRTLCPSGVCMDFISQAENFSLEYRILYAARNWAFFDVYTDGVFEQSIQLPNLESGRLSIQFVKKGNKRITIYLPHLVHIELRNIYASEPYSLAEPMSKRVLFLGDSITQGMNARRPSSCYPVQLSRFWGCEHLNLAIGGDIMSADHLDTLPFQPDRIVIAYGTNDWSRPTELLLSNVRGFLKKLDALYPCRDVWGLLPIWREDCSKTVHPCGSFEELKLILREEYANYPHIKVINGDRLVPHMTHYVEDGLHPNDEGFLHYSTGLLKSMDRM